MALGTPSRVLHDPMESVGDRVRRHRRFRGLTQEALADRADVERRYLGKIETGDVLEPGAETVKKLARALGVPVRQLAEPLGWWDDEESFAGDWQAALMADPRLDESAKQALITIMDKFVDKGTTT